MKKLLFLSFLMLLSFIGKAQNEPAPPGRLRVYIDCSNTFCDMNFIRTEITLVDFLLDPVASDVHLLITSKQTGSGGNKYQLIFFGQNYFRNRQDTLSFFVDATATDFERRDALIRYIKLGLVPFIGTTSFAKDITIGMKLADTGKKSSAVSPARDPWNYWVFRPGVNGGLNADANYKNLRYSGNLSANRVTNELKVSFSFNANKNKSIYAFTDTSGNTEKITVNNQSLNFTHYLIKSINSHWSWGYEADFNQSSFSNLKAQYITRTGVEYDIYPYSDVNNRLFTISYTLGIRANRYYDTTIYDKLRETLLNHEVDATLTFNQKWGSASVGITYQNYLQNWKYFNLSMNAFINVRISGGLSFNFGAFGALTRDQVFLAKGGASEQEVLTRRRQLASGYNYFTSFGINYRFGSKLNNFVNPRFDGGGGNFYFF